MTEGLAGTGPGQRLVRHRPPPLLEREHCHYCGPPLPRDTITARNLQNPAASDPSKSLYQVNENGTSYQIIQIREIIGISYPSAQSAISIGVPAGAGLESGGKFVDVNSPF